MDAQESDNQAFMAPRPEQVADRAMLEALLIAKNGPSGEPPLPGQKSTKTFDPIASAMARHPGLAREEAEEMAASFGF